MLTKEPYEDTSKIIRLIEIALKAQEQYLSTIHLSEEDVKEAQKHFQPLLKDLKDQSATPL